MDTLGTIQPLDVLAALILGLIFTIISLAVILIILITLLQRIIWLWILAVLSPVPYVQSVLPFLKGNFGFDWWQEFSRYVTIGPVLAFCLWFTLFTIQSTQGQTSFLSGPSPEISAPTTQNNFTETVFAQSAPTPSGGPSSVSVAPTQVGTGSFILSYAIAIGMLMASLMLAAKIGGVAGSMAGKAQGAIKSAGKKLSGAQALGDVMGQIKSGRESKRKQKAQARAQKLTRAVSKIGTAPGRALGWGGGKVPGVKALKERTEKRRKAKMDRIAQLRQEAMDSKTSAGERRKKLMKAWAMEKQLGIGRKGGRVVAAVATGGATEIARAIHKGFKDVGMIGENLTRDAVFSSKDKLKTETDSKVLSNINDTGLDNNTRIASILAAADRNLVKREDIPGYEDLISRLGGGEQMNRAFMNSIKDQFPDAAIKAKGRVLSEDDYKSIGRDIKVGKLDVEKIDAASFNAEESGRNLAYQVSQNASGKKIDAIMEDTDKRKGYQEGTGAWIQQAGAIDRETDLRSSDPDVLARAQAYAARQKIGSHHLMAGGSVETALAHEGSADDGHGSLKAESRQLLEDMMKGSGGLKTALNVSNKELTSGTLGAESLEVIVHSMDYPRLAQMMKDAKTDNQLENFTTYLAEIKRLGSFTGGDAKMQELTRQIRSNAVMNSYVK